MYLNVYTDEKEAHEVNVTENELHGLRTYWLATGTLEVSLEMSRSLAANW